MRPADRRHVDPRRLPAEVQERIHANTQAALVAMNYCLEEIAALPEDEQKRISEMLWDIVDAREADPEAVDIDSSPNCCSQRCTEEEKTTALIQQGDGYEYHYHK